MLKEFKEFAVKGNVIDMAVGIVIGAAFGKIVSTFVAGIVMPIVGLLTGGIDFSKNYILLGGGPEDGSGFASLAAAEEAGAAVLKWGEFAQVTLDFVIVAFAIFMVVKMINKAKKEEEAKEEEAPAEPPKEEVLLTEIRDLLKK